LFGKLSTPVEFRCRKYEECLFDVAITHSPRYLIDMEIGKDESIFAKIGIVNHALRGTFTAGGTIEIDGNRWNCLSWNIQIS